MEILYSSAAERKIVPRNQMQKFHLRSEGN